MIEAPKKATIIRNFTISLDENDKGITAKGFIESNLEMTEHEVHVYEGYKNDDEIIFDYYEDDEDGTYYLEPFNLGRDITLEDIINELDKLDVDDE